MPRDHLNPPNNVYGSFTLERGKLTFRTGDARLTRRLQTDRDNDRNSTVYLLSTSPLQEFTGTLESVKLVKIERPQESEVVMVEKGGKPRKRG